MEENKNIELAQNQNNEEILNEESATVEEVIEEIDSDFSDINKDEMKKNYIIIGILYLVVVILSIFLVIGIKNQKDTVKNKIDNDKKVNDVVEEEKNDKNDIPPEQTEENIVTEEPSKEEKAEQNIVPDINNNNELNILDQI